MRAVLTVTVVATLVDSAISYAPSSIQTFARERAFGGTCFQNTLVDQAALDTVRLEMVKFNQQKRYVASSQHLMPPY